MLALLALLAATPACAHRLPVCLKTSSETQRLADLKACQEESWEKFLTKKDEKGALPTTDDLDRLDEHQRAEARRLLAKSKEVLDGDTVPAGAHPGELGGATGRDLSRTDAKTAKSVSDLQARMHAAAGDGRDGITPAMVDDIKQTLGGAKGEGLDLNIDAKTEKELLERDFDADKTAPPPGNM